MSISYLTFFKGASKGRNSHQLNYAICNKPFFLAEEQERGQEYTVSLAHCNFILSAKQCGLHHIQGFQELAEMKIKATSRWTETEFYDGGKWYIQKSKSRSQSKFSIFQFQSRSFGEDILFSSFLCTYATRGDVCEFTKVSPLSLSRNLSSHDFISRTNDDTGKTEKTSNIPHNARVSCIIIHQLQERTE